MYAQNECSTPSKMHPPKKGPSRHWALKAAEAPTCQPKHQVVAALRHSLEVHLHHMEKKAAWWHLSHCHPCWNSSHPPPNARSRWTQVHTVQADPNPVHQNETSLVHPRAHTNWDLCWWPSFWCCLAVGPNVVFWVHVLKHLHHHLTLVSKAALAQNQPWLSSKNFHLHLEHCHHAFDFRAHPLQHQPLRSCVHQRASAFAPPHLLGAHLDLLQDVQLHRPVLEWPPHQSLEVRLLQLQKQMVQRAACCKPSCDQVKHSQTPKVLKPLHQDLPTQMAWVVFGYFWSQRCWLPLQQYAHHWPSSFPTKFHVAIELQPFCQFWDSQARSLQTLPACLNTLCLSSFRRQWHQQQLQNGYGSKQSEEWPMRRVDVNMEKLSCHLRTLSQSAQWKCQLDFWFAAKMILLHHLPDDHWLELARGVL